MSNMEYMNSMSSAIEPLTIAINALTTRGNAGVRSYLKRISQQMPLAYPDDKYIIFVNSEIYSDFEKTPPNVTVYSVEFAFHRTSQRMLFEQILLPIYLLKHNADVLYILAVTDVFLSPCPSIIRVGNMLPYTREAIKTQNSFRNKARLHMLKISTAISRRTSDRTLVMSDAAAQILVSDCGFNAKKTVGINRGVSEESTHLQSYQGKKIDEPYILIVSHVSEYKCLAEIVAACVLLGSKLQNHKILIAGTIKDLAFGKMIVDTIAAASINGDIQMVGFVPREQLGELIEGASFCIFPSMVETCPVTLIEMMMGGRALIVSDQSVMPALCGDAVIYYDPRDTHELAKCMEFFIQSPAERSKYSEAAKQRVKKIGVDWETAIRSRRALFDRVVSENR